MNKIVKVVVLLIGMLLCFGCEKQISEVVDKEERNLAGKYHVTNYKVTVYDKLGKELSTADNQDYGTVELTMNTNEGEDIFSHFKFQGNVAYTFVPQKINTSSYCGFQDPSNKVFSVFYQCDPDKKRFLFAAICPMQTLTYLVDYEFDGTNFVFFTRVVDQISGNQTFYEYQLVKI